MTRIKQLVKNGFRSLGYEIRRITPKTNSACQTVKALNNFNIDLVLDVGANVGQFVSELRSHGYTGKIVSFEPLSAVMSRLEAAAHNDTKWVIHPATAVGAYDGEIEINVSGNTYSSSVLPMMQAHSSASPSSAYVGSETVPIVKIDSVISEYASSAAHPFLKIDTQGFEWEVLDGATESLPLISGILCELSIVPLYEGQRPWTDVVRRIEDCGFTLWALQQGFTDPRSGRTLQFDGLFFRA